VPTNMSHDIPPFDHPRGGSLMEAARRPPRANPSVSNPFGSNAATRQIEVGSAPIYFGHVT
jgi:hypothetical protein